MEGSFASSCRRGELLEDVTTTKCGTTVAHFPNLNITTKSDVLSARDRDGNTR